MITLQQEFLYDVVDDVEPLLEMHYNELTLNKESIKLDPIWTRYAALEQAEALAIYTARDDAKLVGYSAFFVTKHMHYAALTIVANDVLFLHPDHRTGRTGIRLIKFCESALREKLGNFKLTWHANYSNHLASILSRMGYVSEEVVLSKLF